MNNILAQLNSVPMYAICGGIIAFVAVVCVIFLVRSYRAGLAIGIDSARMKRAITSSATFSVLPSVGILLGVIAAWLFIGLKKLIKNETASIGLSAGIATLCHSAMVLGLMWFLFDSLPLKEVFATMMSLNCLLEIAMAVVVGMAVCKPLLVYLRKQKLIQK